jgi:hypothetical protein
MDPLILFQAKTRRKPLGIAHKYYTGAGVTDNLTPQTYWYFKIVIYIWPLNFLSFKNNTSSMLQSYPKTTSY